jgi:predicted  nucleic acid-binding Zn-ribbon protein
MQTIRDVLDASPQPQAQRIARKLADYTGEIAQVESLRRELAKLQIEAEAREGLQQDLADAVQSLREILRDEEDAMAAVMALHDHEARHLLGMLGISVH